MLSAYHMETLPVGSTQERDALEDERSSVKVNRELEAARYALLQRLTPAIRHQVAGVFQPIMMLVSMVQRLVQAPSADLEKIGTHCASMHSFSRSGARGSQECFSWFSATQRIDVGVNDGVGECLNLVSTELALREFTIINDLTTCTAIWPQDALRNVFMAALLAITDVTPSPAALVLSSECDVSGLALTLTVRSASDAVLRESVPIYRKIEWLDVALLAEAEGVRLERTASGVRLSLLPDVG
jgi:hypothetical protein